MGFRINTNIAALSSHTSATMNNRSLDNSLSRLSSGLRINKAADDASGMAIADSLRAQANGLNQAINNANDGVAVVQTADGALDEYINIINTVRTKSIQAASDGQNTESRAAIQRDIDALLKSANSIAKTTQFNGQNLLDGSFTNKAFHIGAYAGETATLSVSNTQTDALGDIKGITGTTTRTAYESNDYVDGATGQALASGLLTINGTDMSESINELSPLRTNDAAALATAITDATGFVASGENTLTSAVAVAGGSINSTNMLKINGVAIADTTVLANDSDGALRNAINNISDETGVTATVDTAGKLVLESSGGSNISITTSSAQAAVAQIDTVSLTGNFTAGTIDATINGAAITSVASTGNHVTDMGTLATNITAADGGDKVTGAYTAATSTATISGALVLAADTFTWNDGATTYSYAAIGATEATDTIGAGLATAIGGNADNLYNAVYDAGTDTLTITSTSSGTVVAGTFAASAGTAAGANTAVTADSFTITSQAAGTGFTSTIDTSAATGLTAAIAPTVVNQAEITSVSASSTVTGLTTDNLTSQTGTAVSTLTSSATANVTIGQGELIINGQDMAGTYGDNVTAGSAASALEAAIQAIDGMEDSSINALGVISLVVNNGDDLNIGGTTGASTYSLAEGITNQSKAGSVKIFSDSAVKIGGTDEDSFGFTSGTYAPVSTGVSLDSIDVTTRESAEVAILIADSALTALDTIRSELGSVQNQLESTIRNISVTSVNVKSAESQIRDVDFAAESANFSKYNILAQSGSYAMSQANAVQQNVLRLLQ